MNNSVTQFPDLPEDVGCTIFELAAKNGDGPCCARVSRYNIGALLNCAVHYWVLKLNERVHGRVEPKIYYRITLQNERVADLFCRTLLDPEASKAPEFFATHIKIFALAGISVNDKIAAALRKCRGIQTLLVWSHISNRNLQDIVNSSEPVLTPSRLAVFGEIFPEGRYQFHYPTFHKVTHLDIVCFQEADWKEGASLSQLKCLTHFSLDIRYRPSGFVEMVREVLHMCSSELRILIIWSDEGCFSESDHCFGDVKAISEGEVDVRAVNGCMDSRPPNMLGIYRDGYHLFEDWADTSADPENDFWAQAEAVIQGRRRHLEQVRKLASLSIVSFD